VNCTQQINLSLGLCACGSCYVLKTPQRCPDFTGGSLLLGAKCWPCPLTIFSSRSQRGAAALMGRGYGTLTGCCATRLPPLACFMLPVPLICPQGVRNGMGRRCGSSQRTSWACNSLLNSNFGFKNGFAPSALARAHRTDAHQSPRVRTSSWLTPVRSVEPPDRSLGRALHDSTIESVCANSPPAKRRVKA
jgi:hypothetical protein